MNRNKKLNIMIVPTGGLGMEGITCSIMNYYNSINKSKTKFTFVVTGIIGDIEYFNKIKQIIISNGDKVVEVNRKKNPIKYFFYITEMMKKEKYDVIHIHGSSSLMVIEVLAAKIANISNRIVHSHNTTCNYRIINKLLKPILLKLTTCRVACGEAAGEWLFGENKFLILKNGIDVNKFSYDNQKRELMRKELDLDKKKVIGHVGTFNNQKNQEFLIGILKELVKRDSSYYMVLIGDGDKREEVEKKVIDEGLEKNIIFLGIRSDIADILQAMDFMILPSLYEGLPLVAIEWQVAGLRCILSDNVTKEVKLTELINFMSLEEKPLKWADKVEDLIEYKRNNYYKEEICKKGYNIETNSQELMKIYTNS